MSNFSLISMTKFKDLKDRNNRQANLIEKLRLINGSLKQRIEKLQSIVDVLRKPKITFKEKAKDDANQIFKGLKK